MVPTASRNLALATRGRCPLVDGLPFNRFVIAVFRRWTDLASTIDRLLASNFDASQVLVLVPLENAAALAPGNTTELAEITITTLPARRAVQSIGLEVGDLLDRLDKGSAADGTMKTSRAEPIYCLLPQELAAGSIILILSVIDAEQQVRGARTLLNGPSKCVLTHDMLARHA